MNKNNLEFTQCRRNFLSHISRMDYSPETYRGYEKDLEFFHKFILDYRSIDSIIINEITKDDLLAFMDYGKEREHKANTIARRLSTIKSFYKFLVNEMDYPVDVAARIKLPKVYIPLFDILNEKEIKLLLDQAKLVNSFYHLFFSLMYHTGSRLTPILLLEKKNVNLEDRVLYFPRVKGGKDLYLPLHESLVELFIKHFEQDTIRNNSLVFPSKKFPEQPISATDIRIKLTKIANQAGITKRITPHGIRHAMATHLTIKKVDQRSIANILGHTDLRSTARYQHLTTEHLRDAIDLL